MGGEWSGMDPAFRNSVLAAITLVPRPPPPSQAWVRNRHGEGATGPVDVKWFPRPATSRALRLAR